jgi:hypothetical protein
MTIGHFAGSAAWMTLAVMSSATAHAVTVRILVVMDSPNF